MDGVQLAVLEHLLTIDYFTMDYFTKQNKTKQNKTTDILIDKRTQKTDLVANSISGPGPVTIQTLLCA